MNGSTRLGPGLAPGPLDTCFPQSLSAEQVFHDYAPRVYHVARRMLSSDVDAEDVTQDVLLQVVRKLPTFHGAASFPTWLHRVTINAALSLRRKQAGREEHCLPYRLDSLSVNEGPAPRRCPAPSPEGTLIDREARHFIDRAIDGLPDTYREVFVLSDVEGLANAEIADRLGLSLPALKSRLHRARLLLRQALTPYFEDAVL